MREITAELTARIAKHLQTIYGERGNELLPQIVQLVGDYADRIPSSRGPLWSERDMALITYGDQISEPSQPTLDTLRRFLSERRLEELFSIVHILPFCPYSSDDGFSVIDFRQVDSRLGDWPQLRQLSQHVDLMYDLVLNHISQQSEWFQRYLQGDPRYANWFIAVDPSTDLSQVTRPRSHPLLTPFATPQGERFVWTTFSADQIDLNYAEPAVLLEMLDILLMYAAHGARVIRLDAIAFLWKQIGTTCLHLPQTHAAVKLFRAALEAAAPHVLVLTETNVPHTENISYFGDGDEAHLVYNFSLPPLLFDAYVHGEATPLRNWLSALDAPRPGTTWFNFTASHDGIGVRPLEGLVDRDRRQRLVDATRQRGGEVGMRKLPSGELSPYELNITWRDAMRTPGGDDPYLVQRMLASQAFMLALQGLPATYFHALAGTPNDIEGRQQSGQPRSINRRKYHLGELNGLLSGDAIQSAIFRGYCELLALRKRQPAFHPDARQRVLETANPSVVAFERTSLDNDQSIIVAANFATSPQTWDSGNCDVSRGCHDLIADSEFDTAQPTLEPCQIVWLTTS